MADASDLIEQVESVIDESKKPAQTIAPIILSPALKTRCGLSAIRLYTNIAARLPEAGIPAGDNTDGSENVVKELLRIICEELINEIKDNALVESVADIGTIISTGAAGTIPVTTTNTTFNEFRGTII